MDHNATQAALRAGYSAKTARVQGSRLLTNVDIKAEIEQKSTGHLAEVSEEAREAVLSRHQVLQEDSAIAASDVTELIEMWTREGPLWKNLKVLRCTPSDVSRCRLGVIECGRLDHARTQWTGCLTAATPG